MADITDVDEMKYRIDVTVNATDAYYWCAKNLGLRSAIRAKNKWDAHFIPDLAIFEFKFEADAMWFALNWK